MVKDHLALRKIGDLETDLARNFAADCLLLSNHGVFRGRDGMREAAGMLNHQLGKATFDYHEVLTSDAIGFLQWSASGSRGSVHHGANSYVVRDGRIVAMTAHYRVESRREVRDLEGVARKFGVSVEEVCEAPAGAFRLT